MTFDPKAIQDDLVSAALAYPEAWEDHPWGERVAKVRKKVFLFSHATEQRFSCSVKLPEDHLAVCELPFCSPTGYGLGKWGWVSVTITEGVDVPMDVLLEWMDTSYRAVAPKTLVRKLPPLDH